MLKVVGKFFLWLLVCGVLIFILSPVFSIFLDVLWDFVLK
jgi:hypothetical protein